MKKIRIVIVEDEALIADHIAICLEDLGYDVVGIEEDGSEALETIQNLQPDLCILDINLAGALDGVDVAQEINRRFSIPFIFLTSNSDKRTLERVKITEPAGFILKPYTVQDLETNLGIVLYKLRRAASEAAKGNEQDSKNLKENGLKPDSETSTDGNKQESEENPGPSRLANDDSFFIKEKHELIRIHYGDISHVEAMDNYARIHTSKGRFVLSQTLKNVEKRLEAHGFLRVHRSYVVNLTHIDLIAPRHLVLGPEQIPISETQRQKLMERIQLF